MNRGFALTLILLSILVVASLFIPTPERGSPLSVYTYRFYVDEDGNTYVNVEFESSVENGGSSWLILPTYANWSLQVSSGSIEWSSFKPLSEGNIFWGNYTFRFKPGEEGFKISFNFSIPLYTFIVEPKGFFLSPLIGFPRSSKGEAELKIAGDGIKIVDVFGLSEALSFIREMLPTRIEREGEETKLSLEVRPVSRVGVVFVKKDSHPENVTVERPPFRIEVPTRYSEIAERILELYVEAYHKLSGILGVKPNETVIEVKLFVPDLEQFKEGVAGFVPISADKPGPISLNLFNLRYPNGTMELVALHELTHHFIWATGLEVNRLWIHEGLAEYLSIELAERLGYMLAAEMRRTQHREAYAVVNGSSLSFIQAWSFVSRPTDLRTLYASSFHVFEALGEKYGGLEFYGKVFEKLRGIPGVKEDSALATAVGLALEASDRGVVEFRRMGLTGIVNLLALKARIAYLEETTERIPEIQISKPILEGILAYIHTLYKTGSYSEAAWLANLAVALAENFSLLSAAVYSLLASLIAVAFILKEKIRED